MKTNPAECDYGCRRLLPWLLLLFFGSGLAALVCEVVWLQLLNYPEDQPVRQSLEEVGFGRFEDPQHGIVVDLFATFAGQVSDLGDWMQKAQINRDKNLRLQYLSGMWLNSYLGTRIFQSILCYYRFPDNIFKGSDPYLNSLKMALARGGRREIAPAASP